jgi:broad specificity phosphatase PhoE
MDMRGRLWLVRHGETDWSVSHRHTGRTDVNLNARGRAQAQALGRGLAGLGVAFTHAFTSPLLRARETARLAGFGAATPLAALREWDYGEFEGRTTGEIRSELGSDWLVWDARIEEGETPEDVGRRADEARALLEQKGGDVIVFAHGHFLRIFAAHWIGLPARAGRRLALHTGTVSILGYEHEYRVIERWNAPLGAEPDTW